jgi:hypothetical protein
MTATAHELPPAVRRLIAAEAEPVSWALRSGTTVDTGSWLRRAPLFAAVVGDRFVLAADGPRPFLRTVPVAALQRAVYNHVTGELALPAKAAAAAENAPGVHGLRIDPFAARTLVEIAAARAATPSPVPARVGATHTHPED